MSPRLDHIGVAVRDVDAAAAYFALHYGLAVEQDHLAERDGVRELMLRAGGCYIQLLEPSRPDSPVARFLDRQGEGIHHLAMRVPDLSATLDGLAQAGVRLVDERPREGAGGHLIAFAHPRSTFGVLTELIQER